MPDNNRHRNGKGRSITCAIRRRVDDRLQIVAFGGLSDEGAAFLRQVHACSEYDLVRKMAILNLIADDGNVIDKIWSQTERLVDALGRVDLVDNTRIAGDKLLAEKRQVSGKLLPLGGVGKSQKAEIPRSSFARRRRPVFHIH